MIPSLRSSGFTFKRVFKALIIGPRPCKCWSKGYGVISGKDLEKLRELIYDVKFYELDCKIKKLHSEIDELNAIIVDKYDVLIDRAPFKRQMHLERQEAYHINMREKAALRLAENK